MLRHIAHALASLRWRLTLSFVALLAVLLVALGAYEYFSLRASLIANRVASMQDDYNTSRVLIGRLAVAGSAARGRILCAQAPALVGRTVAQIVAASSGQAVSVVLYDPSLSVVATAPPNAEQLQLNRQALRTVVLTGRRSNAEVIGTSSGERLAVGFPINVGHNVCGVAQMSTAMTPINNVLRDELILIGIGGAVFLALALLIGLVLTARTLRPLQRLTTTAQQLARGDLHARSLLVPRTDEVGALASSFDHMAERIEASFTAQKASEEQVRRFIADASHELRTPVTALKGYIDVLRRGAAQDPAALEGALDAMSREADRMRELVLDLLTLARLDARREAQLETFDLSEELANLLDEGVPGMPERVERQLMPSLVVRADRAALRTMVRNVLVNACKYAAGAPQRWSTAVDGNRARIDAHDDGPGIAATDLPHVFERFYRGDKTRAREEGGSGLGLSIVQGLARSQGGDAAIYSAEGAGTTVTVWLPLTS